MFEKKIADWLWQNAGVVSARHMMLTALRLGNPDSAAYWGRILVRRSRAMNPVRRRMARFLVRLAGFHRR